MKERNVGYVGEEDRAGGKGPGDPREDHALKDMAEAERHRRYESVVFVSNATEQTVTEDLIEQLRTRGYDVVTKIENIKEKLKGERRCGVLIVFVRQ